LSPDPVELQEDLCIMGMLRHESIILILESREGACEGITALSEFGLSIVESVGFDSEGGKLNIRLSLLGSELF